ncbi:SDR family NAD(P)-dependent oxidoreductase [Nocardia sp. NPDC056000]|uniref:SDR family NAD(P)-dependent oxidoreductase n=1 Tax=Nocardia sp. NPDC056000 TaxID=3345674 RepID=UPI0035DB4B53
MNTRVQHNDSTQVQLPAATAAYWADRHVVITGGSSGIGLAVTELALGAGAKVSVLALDDPAMSALAARTGDFDGRLATFTANVTSPDQIRTALHGARSQHGPIGAVIACAGIAKPGYFTELSESDFRNHMEVNYFGTLTPIREALPDLLTADRASITAISSAAGFLSLIGYSAYSPSKFAVRAAAEALRQELKPKGITVTVVYPPDVDTPQLAAEAATKPRELSALSSGTPMTAPAVARALLIGAASGKPTVLPNLATRILRRITTTAPELTAHYVDWIIARIQRGRR